MLRPTLRTPRPTRALLIAILLVLGIGYYSLSQSGGSGSDLFEQFANPASAGANAVLKYSDDGILRGWDAAHAILKNKAKAASLGKRERKGLEEIVKRHPIEVLMQRGKDAWEGLLARQSKTLPQAVIRYTERYGRPPPKGFEDWWRFCRKNGVKIVDDYDQIDSDIRPYFALSPSLFRKRVAALKETEHSYQINLDPTSPTLTGVRSMSSRGKLLFTLLSPLASSFPPLQDGSPITLHVSDHDLGSWIVGHDQILATQEAVRDGRYMSEEELKPFEKKEGRGPVKGLLSACPEDSRGWQVGLARKEGEEIDFTDRETTFIHDALPTYDYCTHPSLLHSHGSLSFDFSHDTTLRPIFQLSKFIRNGEFLTTPLEAYLNASDSRSIEVFTPWSKKDIPKLFWRGSSTGDSYSKRKNYDWRQSHRPRLHLHAQNETGQSDVWVKRGKGWEREKWGRKRLGEVYFDVGLSGKPHQCRQEDGTCDEMAEAMKFKDRVRPEDSVRYKYVFDIDGNGWSSRFHRLMLSGSMVVKSTIYPEWMSGWLIPWYHYVPAKIDYTDLYDIMSFFVGPPDGRAGENDAAAQAIAEQGRKFAVEHWRWEDMQAYMYRLLLEYARLMADDRDAWSYQKTYTHKNKDQRVA